MYETHFLFTTLQNLVRLTLKKKYCILTIPAVKNRQIEEETDREIYGQYRRQDTYRQIHTQHKREDTDREIHRQNRREDTDREIHGQYGRKDTDTWTP